MKLFWMMLLSVAFLQASYIATVEKTQGRVNVLAQNAIKGKKAKIAQKLYKEDLIVTYSDSKVKIKLLDDSIVTLDANSKLKLEDINKLKHEEGKVFFSIKTQTTNQLEVGTNFATIGVKGTQFIITDNKQNQTVSLKKGLVGVKALDGEFKIHRQQVRELTEYEKYVLAHKHDYEAYEKKIVEEFIEFKKEFDLKPRKMVSFNKNVVKEKDLTQEVEQEFENLEKF
jgi:ferric-dicitrate binding protein FerR (iron transport regulator)